jgi:hypothetical protein
MVQKDSGALMKISPPANPSSLFVTVLAAGFLQACTTVKTEYELPSQSLSAPAREDTARVVFYNTGPARIGIKLDGRGIGAPRVGQYIRVDLEPGRHHLDLSHVDTVEFHDDHSLNVTGEEMYVRVFSTDLSTDFDVQAGAPDGFGKFKPIRQ